MTYYAKNEDGKLVEVAEEYDLSPEMREAVASLQDNVNSPAHYTQGDIEPIDFMRSTATKEEFTGHCTLTAIKYLSRWRHKGGVEDLRKAEKYLQWAIEREIQ